MKGYGMLVLRSAIQAWEWAGLVTALACLGVAYVAFGSLAERPLPPEDKPAMRSSAEMGRRLGRTLQYGCLGFGGILVAGMLIPRFKR